MISYSGTYLLVSGTWYHTRSKIESVHFEDSIKVVTTSLNLSQWNKKHGKLSLSLTDLRTGRKKSLIHWKSVRRSYKNEAGELEARLQGKTYKRSFLLATQLDHKTKCISNPRWNQFGRWAGRFPQLISHSAQILTLAALSAIAASTPVVYPPVTLMPYEHDNCTCKDKAGSIRGGLHQPKGIEIPLGSCIDTPFFKSYKATKPKSEPDVPECYLYIFSGPGCTLDAFISPDLNEVPPKCYNTARPQHETFGAKSALYTCEGWTVWWLFLGRATFSSSTWGGEGKNGSFCRKMTRRTGNMGEGWPSSKVPRRACNITRALEDLTVKF